MVDVIVLGIIQAEVYMLMYIYGTELGALLLIPAIVLTLAPMLLIAYCHGCVERFFHNRRAASGRRLEPSASCVRISGSPSLERRSLP
jgi:hypothetical protein